MKFKYNYDLFEEDNARIFLVFLCTKDYLQLLRQKKSVAENVKHKTFQNRSWLFSGAPVNYIVTGVHYNPSTTRSNH